MVGYLALGLAVLVGSLTSLQSAINTELSKHIGGVAAALASFFVGTVTLALLYAFSGESGLKNAANVNPVLWIGGLFGALFVFSMIKLIPKIGVSSTMAGVIAGQLLLAMAIDHFGWFGLAKFGMNWSRGIGAVLLLLGVKLISR